MDRQNLPAILLKFDTGYFLWLNQYSIGYHTGSIKVNRSDKVHDINNDRKLF